MVNEFVILAYILVYIFVIAGMFATFVYCMRVCAYYFVEEDEWMLDVNNRIHEIPLDVVDMFEMLEDIDDEWG